MKNKILFFLILIFSILNLGDIVTTFFILPGESNPLYLLTKSIWLLVGLKIILNMVIWYFYFKSEFESNLSYYMLILVCNMAILLLGLACYFNIQGIMNPAIIEASAMLPTEVKIQSYFSFTTFFYLFPALFSLLAFWLYDKSIKCVTIKRK